MKHARGCDGDIPGSPGCICSYPEPAEGAKRLAEKLSALEHMVACCMISSETHQRLRRQAIDDFKNQEPNMDRSDEIRTAVSKARSRAHAAMLREAIGHLSDPPLARAIIEGVLRDLEPPVAKARDNALRASEHPSR